MALGGIKGNEATSFSRRCLLVADAFCTSLARTRTRTLTPESRVLDCEATVLFD